MTNATCTRDGYRVTLPASLTAPMRLTTRSGYDLACVALTNAGRTLIEVANWTGRSAYDAFNGGAWHRNADDLVALAHSMPEDDGTDRAAAAEWVATTIPDLAARYGISDENAAWMRDLAMSWLNEGDSTS